MIWLILNNDGNDDGNDNYDSIDIDIGCDIGIDDDDDDDDDNYDDDNNDGIDLFYYSLLISYSLFLKLLLLLINGSIILKS